MVEHLRERRSWEERAQCANNSSLRVAITFLDMMDTEATSLRRLLTLQLYGLMRYVGDGRMVSSLSGRAK